MKREHCDGCGEPYNLLVYSPSLDSWLCDRCRQKKFNVTVDNDPYIGAALFR